MKIWSEHEIVNLINTNNTMVGRTLVKLYNRQTQDEQRDKETKYTNKRGFNHGDAKLLTSLAQYFIQYGNLTEKQLEVARVRLFKYRKQITRMANGEI